MDKEIFLYNYRNQLYPPKTCLCYEMEYQQGNEWIQVKKSISFLPNQDLQAEEVILRKISSWELNKGLHYRITFYISWSPGKKCADQLAAFLRENRHVCLRMFIARISRGQNYKAGLRALKAAGAKIAMMTFKEFKNCWEHFVDNQGRPFPSWDDLCVKSEKLSKKLEDILQIQEE